MDVTKKELKEKLSDHIKKIANINDLELNLNKRIINLTKERLQTQLQYFEKQSA